MAKKKQTQRRKPPAPKEIKFNFGAGEERMAKIAVPGFASFSITYRVPGTEWEANIAMEQNGSQTDEATASRGRMMIQYIAAHMVRWSLPPAPTEESISALSEVAILFALWNEIHGSVSKAKN